MGKRRILTSQAYPGMKIADDVLSSAGQLIIPAETVVTDKVITRLKFYSVHQIVIEEEESAEMEMGTIDDLFAVMDQQVDTLSETTVPAPEAPIEYYSEKVKKTDEFKAFSSDLVKATKHLHDQFAKLTQPGAKINEQEYLTDVANVMKNARNGSHMLDMIHSIRNFDDETYLHSMNVALVANVLGKWLNFSTRELETLSLCALFHDIGKITLPQELIKKPTRLTDAEYNTIKTHPMRGYNLLKSQNANIHVQMTALMHHERCDGSGYPMGIKGDQIDKFAKVVMIADVYEAMTAPRVYRGPLCPLEVIGILETEGIIKYEPKYVLTFLEHINQIYLNNTVRMSDQSIGTIVMMNPNKLSRPVIKIGNRFIDLSKEHTLYIEAII